MIEERWQEETVTKTLSGRPQTDKGSTDLAGRASQRLGTTMAAVLVAVVLPGFCRAEVSISTLAPGVLSVCIYPGFAPTAYRNESGDWAGWDVDFMKLFAESEKLMFEPVEIDEFDDIWRRPGEDICDVAASGITRTSERQQNSPGTQWSDPYFTSRRVLVVKSGDESKVRSVEDLAGRIVAVTKNTTGELDLRRRIEAAAVASVDIIYINGDEEGVETLLDGDVFAFSTDETAATHVISRKDGIAIAWPHPTLTADGSETLEQFSFVVRQASSGVGDALNAYIVENAGQYRGNMN